MPSESALLIAIGALAVGPLLASLLQRRARWHDFLDGFVLSMVAALCLLYLLPHAHESLGFWAFPLALAGLALPHLAESRLQLHRHGESPAVLTLAVIGLALHASIDGATLAIGAGLHGSEAAHAHEAGAGVALAIMLHRLPVGLFLWWSVRPKFGSTRTVLLLLLLGAATFAGHRVSGKVEPLESGLVGGLLHALLAGGLLHVVTDHSHGLRVGPGRWRWPAAMGSLIAAGCFLLLPEEVSPVFRRSLLAVRHLFLESSLAVLIGFTGAGLLTLIPTGTLARHLTGRNAFTSALRGMLFGLPLPICSCGVVPLYRGLVKTGAPAAAAMAFLVATPELGLDAVLLSIPLLGVRLAILRVLAAVLVAMAVGLLAHLLLGNSKAATAVEEESEAPKGTRGERIRGALRYGLVELIDELGPWILAGILVAGLLEPVLEQSFLAVLPANLDVPLFAVLGTPIYICASGATPVAAVLLAKGVSAGAVLALLLSGPATNVTTFGAVRSAYGTRNSILLVLTVPVATVVIGLLVNSFGQVVPPMTDVAAEHGARWWQTAAALLFALLLLGSFLRQGPRGFLHQLGIGHEHEDEHEEDACCAGESCGK